MLRKFASAISSHNWFTVILEVLIVVAGIFIGLQADDWNRSRLDDRRAHQALEDLQADFEDISAVAGDLADYYKHNIDDLQILVRNVKAGAINSGDEPAIRRAIAYGGDFGDPPPPSGTFRDLSGSGELSLVRNKELRLRLIEYDQSLEIILMSDVSIHDQLGHFRYAFKRYATFSDTFEVPDTPDLAYVDVTFPSIDHVDYDRLLGDADFRIAAEQHLGAQISRYVNIRVSQSKIRQIQELIEQSLGRATPAQLQAPR